MMLLRVRSCISVHRVRSPGDVPTDDARLRAGLLDVAPSVRVGSADYSHRSRFGIGLTLGSVPAQSFRL